MPCNAPLKGWRSKTFNPSGKRGIVFNPALGYTDQPIDVPCGQCILCRLDKSRQWAIRMLDEGRLYKENCFITLTYADEHLPENANLNLDDFQKFMKRLRKYYEPRKIRFFHCGEYGANVPEKPKHLKQYGISPLGRPHYHAILFNLDFRDKILLEEKNGYSLYYSPTLQTIWPLGFNTVAELSADTAMYTARYVTKKINGDKAEDHYKRLYPDTGLIVDVEPEYTTMSRKPGLGSDYYAKYKNDMYPKDFVTEKGKKYRIPTYYDKKLEVDDEKLFNLIKQKRRQAADEEKMKDDSLRRLSAKVRIQKSKTNLRNEKL